MTLTRGDEETGPNARSAALKHVSQRAWSFWVRECSSDDRSRGDIAVMLERTRDRTMKDLRCQGCLEKDDDPEDASDRGGLAMLATS